VCVEYFSKHADQNPYGSKKPIAKADQCLTPIGSLLRKASVNELLISQKLAQASVNMDKVLAFRCQAFQFSYHLITAWRWSLMQFINLFQP
jgi:hypothetical protein